MCWFPLERTLPMSMETRGHSRAYMKWALGLLKCVKFPITHRMHTSNPYAQGWLYGGNGGGNSAQSPISIFGALPAPFPTTSSLVAFHFTSFNPTILNCTILGPNSRPYFHVTTDSSFAYTVLKNNEGRTLAAISWQTQPIVEVPGTTPKQAARQFLRLSPDQRYTIPKHLIDPTESTYHLSFTRSRGMSVRGAWYTWTPNSESIGVSKVHY
jgi:hypothetical protein